MTCRHSELVVVFSAPAGSLDTWLKVNDQVAQLYWKVRVFAREQHICPKM